MKTLDLRQYGNDPESAARALYDLINEYAKRVYGPDYAADVLLISPTQDPDYVWFGARFGTRIWRVSWESGPPDWGIRLTQLANPDGILFDPEHPEQSPRIKYLVPDGRNDNGYPEFDGPEGWFLEPAYGPDVGFQTI